jgi:hypothetical protein
VIAATDAVSLPAGVTVREGCLYDAVRGESWPLNESGAFVLGRSGEHLGATVGRLASAFALSPETARTDVLQFLWTLNRLALVNVDSRRGRVPRFLDWLQLALRLAPTGSLPAALTRRRSLDTSSALRGLLSCLAATAGRVAVVAAVSVAAAAQLAAFAGRPGVIVPVALGLCTGAGIGLHEAAHAAMLRGVPSALVTRGRRTYVLHRALAPGRRCLVALAGPLAVAAVGVACVCVGVLAGAAWLAAAGCPLAAHALSLTVVGGDGRIACGL